MGTSQQLDLTPQARLTGLISLLRKYYIYIMTTNFEFFEIYLILKLTFLPGTHWAWFMSSMIWGNGIVCVFFKGTSVIDTETRYVTTYHDDHIVTP